MTGKPAPIFAGLISESFEPGPFDPIETWEQHLTEVRAMPDSTLKEYAICHAKRMIASIKRWEKKRMLDARQLSFQFPTDMQTSQQDQAKTLLTPQRSTRMRSERHMKMAALMYGRAQETSDPERRQRRIMLANAHLDLALKATVKEEHSGAKQPASYGIYRPPGAINTLEIEE